MNTLIFTLFNISYAINSIYLYRIVSSPKYYASHIEKITIACPWIIFGIIANYLLFECSKTEESMWMFMFKMMFFEIILFDVNVFYIIS